MLISGYTPYWLYRILPVIYAVSGVGVIVGIGNHWAIFSGLLLISAAMAIVYMRHHHRKEQEMLMAQEAEEAHPRPPVRTAPTSTPAAGSPYMLSWDAAYESGHAVIDRQHRALFESCNTLIRLVAANRSQAEVNPLLDRLIAEVQHHFRTEEALLGERVASEALAEHHRKHEELAQQAIHLVDEFRQDRLECNDMVGFLVSDLVALHVISEAKLLKKA